MVPVPKELTNPVWLPELPQVVTYGFMKLELVPTLFSQLSECNSRLTLIRELKVDESND